MQDLRIAAVACQAVVGDLPFNLAQTERWTWRAKAAGAQLVCFPELNLTGYSNQPVMKELAQPIPGPLTERLRDLARDSGVVLLAGLAEKSPLTRPYASHIAVYPDGRWAVYRKLHLAPPEQPFFAAGDEVPLFSTGSVRFGIQLCFDGHFPELSAAMTAAGAHVLFMPHASPRGDAAAKHASWMRHLPARAYDNSVFVVACNQWGDNGRGLTFPGNAAVFGPAGNLLARHASGQEGMLVADLKAAALAHVQNHPMRHFFPHRRPDLYHRPIRYLP